MHHKHFVHTADVPRGVCFTVLLYIKQTVTLPGVFLVDPADDNDNNFSSHIPPQTTIRSTKTSPIIRLVQKLHNKAHQKFVRHGSHGTGPAASSNGASEATRVRPTFLQVRPSTGDLSPVSPMRLVHEAEHAPHNLLRKITELFGASHFVQYSHVHGSSGLGV